MSWCWCHVDIVGTCVLVSILRGLLPSLWPPLPPGICWVKTFLSMQVCRAHIAIDDNDKWEDDNQMAEPEGPCCSQLLRNKNKVRCIVLLLRWRNPPPTWIIQCQRKNRQHPHISVKGSLSDTYTFTLLHYKKAPLLFSCPLPKWKLTPSPSPPSSPSPPWTVAASSALLVAAAAIADRPVPLASLPAASLPSYGRWYYPDYEEKDNDDDDDDGKNGDDNTFFH